MIKKLLTSSGITNQTMLRTLAEMLGKPISKSKALFIPTGVYPFTGGPNYVWWPIAGKMQAKLVGLGWLSMVLLELTALPSINKEIWLGSSDEADACWFGAAIRCIWPTGWSIGTSR